VVCPLPKGRITDAGKIQGSLFFSVPANVSHRCKHLISVVLLGVADSVNIATKTESCVRLVRLILMILSCSTLIRAV